MPILLGAAYLVGLAAVGSLAYIAGKNKGDRDRDAEGANVPK
jgi:hypothetical protein